MDDYGNELVTPDWITSAPDAGKELQIGEEGGGGDVVNRPAKANFAFLQQLVSGAIGFNLLKNGGFESWSAGTSLAPDGWIKSGGGSVARSADEKTGTYAAQVTYSASDTFIYQDITDYTFLKSEEIVVGIFVKCSTGSIARIKVDDGATSSFSDYHSGMGNYELLIVEHTLDGAASQLRIELHVEGAGNAIFDAGKLEIGEIATAFSQHPNDEHLKAIAYQTSAPANNLYGLLRMECGAFGTGANPITVTFGTAFSKILGIWATCNTASSEGRIAQVNSPATSGFDVRRVKHDGTASTAEGFWFAIGVD